MRVRALSLLTSAAAAAVLAVGVVPAVAAPTTPSVPIADSDATGTYYPRTPTRILDTRSNLGHRGRVGQGGTIELYPNTGNANASAVVLNLTVVNPSTSGYLTGYPTGRAVPRTSSINFAGGRTVANLVTVPIGVGGGIDLYNGLGTADVVADFVGFYAADNTPITVAGLGRGGGYQPTAVQRLLDSRSIPGGALGPKEYGLIGVRYNSDGGHIAALAVNITATNTGGAGYLTAWNGSSNAVPRASTVNFTRGATVASSAIVPTSYCQVTESGEQCSDFARIGIYNGAGANVDVVVDITGYFDDGNLAAPVRYFPLTTPVRVIDSRAIGAKLGPKSTTRYSAANVPGVVDADTVGVDANVTVVRPTGSTYLTLWPYFPGLSKPATSTVNSGAGQVVSNHVLQEIGDPTTPQFNVYNAAGTTDVVFDVSGRFQAVAGGTAKTLPTPASGTSTGWATASGR